MAIFKVSIITEKWVSEVNKSVPVEIKLEYEDYGDVIALIDSLVNGSTSITIKIEREVR